MKYRAHSISGTCTMLMLGLALHPVGLLAQQSPLERLQDVLPPDVAQQLTRQVEGARAASLPEEAVANLALEGVAKGRSGAEVLVAVEALVDHLTEARDALTGGGRALQAGEVEAAAAAMRMGVDGAAIRELAGSQPSGRSLAVPLLVMGSLTDAGMAPGQALAEVAARLSARADDAALVRGASEMGRGVAGGRGMPAQLGPALANGLAGFQVPVAGMNLPVGPPENIPGRPGSLPGPGNPPGPGNIPTPPPGPGGSS